MEIILLLEKRVREYLDVFPKAQNPHDYLFAYGCLELISILEEANGREIIFKDEEGIDNCSHRFK